MQESAWGNKIILPQYSSGTLQVLSTGGQMCSKSICSTLAAWRCACPVPELSLLGGIEVPSLSVRGFACTCSLSYVMPGFPVLPGWPCWTHDSPHPCISVRSSALKSLEQTQHFSARSLLCQNPLFPPPIRASFNHSLLFLCTSLIICQAYTITYAYWSSLIKLNFSESTTQKN